MRIRSFLLLLLFSSAAALVAQTTTNESALTPLTLDEAVRRVLKYNESVQMRVLDAEISRKVHEAERGIFEPQVVGSVEHVDSERPNNTQQLASLGFFSTPVLEEENTIYNGGLEFLTPVGTRLRTGYTLRRLDNNLQRTIDTEYETFVGASLVQPLLKGFGTGATMARIRLAALESDIAFHEFRKQLMLVVSQAEAAYWDLYFTQEQERISEESVALAERILADYKARSEVGVSAELEVLQAEAGRALRQSRRSEARLRVYEGANRLAAMFAEASATTNLTFKVVDEPSLQEEHLSLTENYQIAFTHNPDYLIRLKRADQEDIRVAFAWNQRLPQLDLKGSYGLNGLGRSPADSFDNIEGADHPAWSIGVEFRIPVTGGIRERREYEAAVLSRKKALLGLKEIETQIANSIAAGLQKVRTQLQNVQNYGEVADFYQKLLETQLARVEVGQIDSRTVLETEEKLFEAKMSVVESLVNYRKALLELEFIRGSVLRSRDLDLTKQELRTRTTALLEQRAWSDEVLRQYREDTIAEIENR